MLGRLLDMQSLYQLLQGEPWLVLFLWHHIIGLLELWKYPQIPQGSFNLQPWSLSSEGRTLRSPYTYEVISFSKVDLGKEWASGVKISSNKSSCGEHKIAVFLGHCVSFTQD